MIPKEVIEAIENESRRKAGTPEEYKLIKASMLRGADILDNVLLKYWRQQAEYLKRNNNDKG